MKMIGVLAVAVLTVIGSFTARAQGPLNPSAPPGETMKTLDQIEPRIPIARTSFTCSVEGASYYLTGPLVASGNSPALRIVTNSVTVDLNGFAILGATGSGNGVSVSANCRNIALLNGTISDCHYHGIYAEDAIRCRFERLQILNNGRGGASYDGVHAGKEAQVLACRIERNAVMGLIVGDGSRVFDCTIVSNGVGLVVPSNGRIENNRIERNDSTGLLLTGVDNYVADNYVRDNADNYNLTQNNQLNLLLCEIPENLDWPCSVKLAGTLTCSVTGTNGITVNANNVTIDMAGHTLIGPGEGSRSGIYQSSAYRNLHVFNGKATQWRGTSQAGFYLYGQSDILTDLQASSNIYGIVAGYGSAMARCTASHNVNDGIYANDDCSLANCAAYDNGADGIDADYGCSLANCAAYDNGADGIFAYYGCSLANCAARDNGDDGINAYSGCTLANCAAYNNGNEGIDANSGCSLDHCAARYNGGDGIFAYEGCTLANCSASYNSSNGVHVAYENHVSGCTCDGNGYEGNGAGIYASGADNRIEGNTCTYNDRGIHVTATGNFIVRNTCSGNATNWVISANNKVGTIVNAPNSVAISGNTGGAGVGSTDPWANFTY